MVGMARSKKKKVEASNPTAEGAAEIECDAGAAGEQQQALESSSEASSEAAPQERVRTAAQEKRWQAALEAWQEAVTNAEVHRLLAQKHEQAQKVAKRLYDAKMKRLDAGDKLKRRKNLFGAARRTYEAIIEYNEAQLKCAWAKRSAAEAETAELRAEMRLMELA